MSVAQDMHVSIEIDDAAHETEQSSLRAATLLRWLGVGVFCTGAVLFLLQGLDLANDMVRNWSYLGLMIVVGLIGIALHRFMHDAKSARLLLGIGVTLVPVQFAQLGGLIYEVVNNEGGALAIPVLITGTAMSVIVAWLVSFAGFRVLARDQALLLTQGLMVTCALLLLPVRTGMPVLAMLGALAVLTLGIDALIRRTKQIRTLEAVSGRLLLTLPLGIAMVRYGFYIDSSHGFAVFGCMVSLVWMFVSRLYLPTGRIRECLIGLAIVFGGASSIGVLAEYMVDHLAVFFAGGLIFAASAMSSFQSWYRGIGLFLMSVSLLGPVLDGGVAGQLFGLAVGLVMLGIGYLRRWREPVLSGVLVSLVTLAVMATHAIEHVNFGSWMGLAFAGIGLVILASVAERHGRNLVVRSRGAWQHFKAW
ncbi:MAG: hypothetical protein AAF541_13675 [Pseudomonadota bacterium]